MNAPTYNLVHAVRRFVGLRSAWRRSLALEPRETVRRDEADVEKCPPPKPGSADAVCRPCCCHP